MGGKREHAYLKQFSLIQWLFIAWAAISVLWIAANIPFEYQNTSDVGFHLYNLERFAHTGFSWYNSEWYWGQEYLVTYSPGTYLLGSLFSWMLPGIGGAILAFMVIVVLGSLAGLLGMYRFVRHFTPDKRVQTLAAALYAYSPFVWTSLQHSLPDFLAYMLMPAVLATCIEALQERVRSKTIIAGVLAAVQLLVSIIVAFHTALLVLIWAAYAALTKRRVSYIHALGVAAIAIALSAFWLVPFASAITDPLYGAGKLTIAGGLMSRYVAGIAQAFSPAVIASNIMSVFSPLSRHAVPWMLLLLALPLLWMKHRPMRYFLYAASAGLLLGTFSLLANILSFGMGILQEHSRWYDIANLGLAALAALSLVTLFERAKTTAHKMLLALLGVVVILVFMCTALSPHTTIAVQEAVEQEQPVFSFLAQDSTEYRVLELPYLYMPYSSVIHGKEQLFGSCEYCNRYEKIRSVVAFEPLTTKYASEAPPVARFSGELNTKYVIAYDNHFFPAINATVEYAAVPALQREPELKLVYKHVVNTSGAYWNITPADANILVTEGGLQGTFGAWYVPVVKRLCAKKSSYLSVQCTTEGYTMSFGVIPRTTDGASVLVPYGAAPVLDKMLKRVQYIPLVPFSITKQATPRVQTTYVYENTLLRPRVESVERTQQLGSSQKESFDMFWEQVQAGETTIGVAYGPQLENKSYSQAAVQDIAHSNTAYSFRVQAQQEAFIVVREGYAPGWRASVDGESVPVMLVQPGILGVELPAGSYEVTLEYSNAAARAGLAISLVSLVLLIILGLANSVIKNPSSHRP